MRTILKRFCLFLAACLLSLNTAFADSDIFRWGITAGGNITKVDGSGTGFNYKGWHYDSSGGYFAGSQEMADLGSGDANVMEKMRYFSVPMHVRYDLELPFFSNIVIPYVFAGPQCNFALNDFDLYNLFRQDLESREHLYEVDSEYRTNKRVWKVDLGLGVILFDHFQVSYFYALPLESSFRFKTVYEDTKSHFRMGTHHVGLTFYF